MVSKRSAAAADVRSRVAAADRTSTTDLLAVDLLEAVLVSEAREAQEALISHERVQVRLGYITSTRPKQPNCLPA